MTNDKEPSLAETFAELAWENPKSAMASYGAIQGAAMAITSAPAALGITAETTAAGAAAIGVGTVAASAAAFVSIYEALPEVVNLVREMADDIGLVKIDHHNDLKHSELGQAALDFGQKHGITEKLADGISWLTDKFRDKPVISEAVQQKAEQRRALEATQHEQYTPPSVPNNKPLNVAQKDEHGGR